LTPSSLAVRVHSGWAALVAVAGDVRSPRIVLRRRVEMTDPDDVGARQPYHAAEGMGVPRARAFLARLGERATTRASEELKAAMGDLRRLACPARTVGILQAAGRLPPELGSILASHALIHTADGEHFREALGRAGEGLGLAVVRLRERDLEARASAALGIRPTSLEERLTALGRGLGPPWTADQKRAALLAWLLLATARGGHLGPPDRHTPQ
jgi:hypothetical protein